MTVYVDNMKAEFKPKHAPGRRYVLCHMVADTEAELHAMADQIGVARKWHQGDHYDITQSKRKLAVAAGAIEFTMQELGRWLLARRRKDGDQKRNSKEGREVHEGKARESDNRVLRKSTKAGGRRRE